MGGICPRKSSEYKKGGKKNGRRKHRAHAVANMEMHQSKSYLDTSDVISGDDGTGSYYNTHGAGGDIVGADETVASAQPTSQQPRSVGTRVGESRAIPARVQAAAPSLSNVSEGSVAGSSSSSSSGSGSGRSLSSEQKQGSVESNAARLPPPPPLMVCYGELPPRRMRLVAV